MQIINLDAPEAKSIISEILENKPVILAGSGVSIFKSLKGNDTCLPTGIDFTKDMFDYLIQSHFLETDSHILEYVRKQWRNVVFENLLESCPDHLKLRRIIKKVFLNAESNPIHKCISDSFIKGDISGIITTNYDQCFDDLFKNHKIKKIVTEMNSESINPLVENLYFKIHGSIDDTDGETLVFALSHEGLLDPWKRNLLHNMIRNKSLLIIGYSGSDFEICPELLTIPLKKVFWNLRGGNYSRNAREFSKQKDGYFLVGDIAHLLSSITNRSITLEKGKSSTELFNSVKKEFTEIEIGIWRASILNTIGCASLAFKTSTEVLAMSPDKDNERKVRYQLAKSLYNLGKYNHSAKEYHAIYKQYKLNIKNQVSTLNDCSNSYKVYGNYYQFFTITKKIKHLSEDDRESAAWTMIRFWRLLYLIFEFIHIPPFKNYIRKKVEKKYLSVAKTTIKSGNWVDFQASRQWIERMGIDPDIVKPHLPYAPPPNEEGYDHLAYFVGKSMAFRDRLCKINTPVSEDIKNEFKEIIECCTSFGLYPEVWKLCCINLSKNIYMDKLETKKLLFSSFCKCEYSTIMKVCCLFHAYFHLYKSK